MFSQGSSSQTYLQQSRLIEDDKRMQLELYLQEKVSQISHLRKCFHQIASELREQQEKSINLRPIAITIKEQCRLIKAEFRSIVAEVTAFRNSRRYYEDQIRELPYIISQVILQNRESLCERFREQTDSLRKKYQFELFRIEEQQKTEVQILKAEHRKELEKKDDELNATIAALEKLRVLEQSKVLQFNSSFWGREKGSTREPEGSCSKRMNLDSSRQDSIALSKQLSCSPTKVSTKSRHSIPKTPSVRKRTAEKLSGLENLQQENLDSRLMQSFNCSISSVRQDKRASEFKGIPSLPTIRYSVPIKATPLNGYNTLVIGGKEIYKGMWMNGKFHGRGKLTYNNWTYDGDFSYGLAEGLGSIYLPETTYIGRFVRGQASGEGTLTFNGKKISGMWDQNQLISLL